MNDIAIDFTEKNCGAFISLTPVSDAAKLWVVDNLPDSPMLNGVLTILPHRIDRVIDKIFEAGFNVELVRNG